MRRVLAIASFVSLLLCAATAALWARSYSHRDGFEFWTSKGLLEVQVLRGSFVLDNDSQCRWDAALEDRIARRIAVLHNRVRELSVPLQHASDQWAGASDRFEKGGGGGAAVPMSHLSIEWGDIVHQIFTLQMLGVERVQRRPAFAAWARSVRCGTVAAACTVLPFIWLLAVLARSRRRRQQERLGLCPACSYNLTGNISGTCPECGAAVPRKVGIPA